jgi:hypothetical protein
VQGATLKTYKNLGKLRRKPFWLVSPSEVEDEELKWRQRWVANTGSCFEIKQQNFYLA